MCLRLQDNILSESYSYLVKRCIVQRVFTRETPDPIRAEELISHAR